MFAPISQFLPLEFLIPLFPKHLFSSSLSHKMKAMYSTVQFHRQNILNDQQISQKHTFNRPFSARYNTIRKMGYCVEFTALHCIALRCCCRLRTPNSSVTAERLPGCSAMQDTLRKLSLFFKYFLRCEYYGTSLVKYAFTNILSLSNMFILYCNILFYIV